MNEQNGNAKITSIASILSIALGIIGGIITFCVYVIPLQVETTNLEKEIKENQRIYEKNHDDLDTRLQREFRDVNALTDQKVLSLDERLQKELQLQVDKIDQRIDYIEKFRKKGN